MEVRSYALRWGEGRNEGPHAEGGTTEPHDGEDSNGSGKGAMCGSAADAASASLPTQLSEAKGAIQATGALVVPTALSKGLEPERRHVLLVAHLAPDDLVE